MTLCIGLYLFDDVEILDFAGPLEVFTTASRVFERLHPGAPPPFSTALIARQTKIRTRGGMIVEVPCSLDTHPALDVIVVPGGVVDGELERNEVVTWLAAQASRVRRVASVCTGAFLLGEAGLLEGRRCTTHWEDIAALRSRYPNAHVVSDARFVDDGTVITSAGISAGLDMSLYLVARLADRSLAVRTARQMDYAWHGAPEPATQ
ncbi:DJ-1/PfpI family protein [Niveibacterium umoris]|uniref:Transcriptional regulator GlxA family with amidase domain n=1 Tax=Niveibacterium umoris TaxID=1193620 RepID=A0A840BQF0_9RHOO|nr:DJ-1/PfpI family protein [Niveibacterium umoris]MBB4013758.1 transcriptional regulator GlxA family with amidase domain [Niveibacterium umoris]